MNYSFKKTAIKTARVVILSLLAVIIAGLEIKFPKIAGLTVVALLQILYDALKHKWGANLP